MGASRYCLVLIGASLFALGCAAGPEDGVDVEDYDLDSAPAAVPAPPAGSTCALIQRDGGAGQVWDTDISYGNGPNFSMGWYPQIKSGLSTSEHWAVFKFGFDGIVPPGKVISYAGFNVYVGWNTHSSTVRAHRVIFPWSEASATYNNFGGTAAWDPAVVGSFDGFGWGYRTVDVTGLAQGWHAGNVPNHGILLEEDPILVHHYSASESSSDISKRPSLWLCWEDAPIVDCNDAGEVCETAADCCDLPCNGGTCGAPVCAQPGQSCGAGTPCCNGICNEGVCPGGGGGGGMCDQNGSTCSFDAQCCSGSCWDGTCVSADAGTCVFEDSFDACSPDNPCCGDLHCISDGVQGVCYPNDLSCVGPGQPCNPFDDLCCWHGKSCGANGYCE